MEHFSQSPGFELGELEEELRRPAMMGWSFPDALYGMLTRDKMVRFGSEDPRLLK